MFEIAKYCQICAIDTVERRFNELWSKTGWKMKKSYFLKALYIQKITIFTSVWRCEKCSYFCCCFFDCKVFSSSTLNVIHRDLGIPEYQFGIPVATLSLSVREIHFQKKFFEASLPFIPPNIIIACVRNVSINTCNW